MAACKLIALNARPEMIRALEAGCARQDYRRTVRKNNHHAESDWCWLRPGDLLWVREDWLTTRSGVLWSYATDAPARQPGYVIPQGAPTMPQVYSRFTLVVRDVWRTRACNLTNADAAACGYRDRAALAAAWTERNPDLPWTANPRLVGFSFNILPRNVLAIIQEEAAA